MITALVVDVAVWAAWGTLVGWAGARLPAERLARDSWLTRLRRWEDHGRLYERVGVRRWKDRLPEAGRVFGGTSKRRLPGRSPDGLRAFALETRRAELVHWAAPLPVLVFPVWNPWPLTVVMAAYAVVANGPCLMVQRYNRGRLARVGAA